MSCLTQATEAAVLLRDTPLTEADLLAMAVHAARASFLGQAERSQAEATVRGFARQRGLVLAD